ncbi:hypothetical protein GCM10019016_043160 [Streptomyces prasinosporus]|uniref:Lipoprotein n=1 Tax=Streptomyces prasinosporus TaxID=68256 RepID=A0ABP6TPK8_9ACTN|nr:hypothetical protein [Streptomyces sp. F-7]GHB86497.1 hypothetical protein GCM10010332_07810 [Streptomyces albogriseolus]
MGRGSTSRSAGAFRAPLLAVLAAVLTVAGCAADGSRAARAPSPSADSPSPQVTSDVDLCTSIVSHWSREVLDGRGYGDYQSMGMSGGQYDILREVVDAARAARRQGERDIGPLMERQAREGCAAWYRSGGPGEGPWR